MSIASVIDKGSLQRRFDPSHLCQVDIAFDLFLRGRLKIEFFETSATGHHHPGFFGVGGVDKHALGHSGGTPGRAAAATLKAAGGALLCVRTLFGMKPEASEIIASLKSVIGVASANTLGLGFIRYASPGAATRRGGKELADNAGVRRNAAGRRARVADSHTLM